MKFDRYISHPGNEHGAEAILLTEHSRAVSHIMQSELAAGRTTAKGAEFQTLAKIAGWMHDVAKATTWVQQHLRGRALDANEEYRYHAFPSALVALYAAETYERIDRRDAALAALVVAHHHKRSAPPDPTHSKQTYTSDKQSVRNRYRTVEHQFRNIGEHSGAEAVVNEILTEAAASEYSPSWADFLAWYDRESVMNTLAPALSPRARGQHYYDDLVRLWSALKYADQLAASLGTDLTTRLKDGTEPPESVWALLRSSEQVPMRPAETDAGLTVKKLKQFIRNELPEATGIRARLNSLRDQAREQAMSNVEALVEGEGAVGLVTLPTGFGKTLTGLGTGLKAADLTGGNLVYALPYTSILDQTAAEIKRIFDVDTTDPSFSLHHHLSTTLSNLGNRYTDADIGRSVGTLHAESWRSMVTLTTTVQLFESLAAPTGRQATKLPALQDTVIILDEPQAIPERWWKIVVDLIGLLVTEYESTVILMTATQPRLVEYGTNELESMTLVGDSGEYVKFLAEHPRVEYAIDESVGSDSESLGYRAAAERIAMSAVSGDDILGICNTRRSAQELHGRTEEALTRAGNRQVIKIGAVLNREIECAGSSPSVDKLRSLVLEKAISSQDQETTILGYLSGDIRPNDRQLIIDALYDSDTKTETLLDGDQQVVTISTSVVEAGVDISFDQVYRDLAPIPSIVQSGGRCNRSFGGEMGRVTVWSLAAPSDRDQLPSQVIHGSRGTENLPLLYATEAVLTTNHSRTIPEAQMVGKVVDEFYRYINNRYDPGSEKLAEYVRECSVDELAGERMIEEIADHEDVVICSTAAERRDGGMEDSSTISEQALLQRSGTQVSAQPPAGAETMKVGNSEYYLVDAQSEFYDPVFGLKSV